MNYKEFEQMIADYLDDKGINYKWEGAKIRYGGKCSHGKCDFILDNVAIEAKVVDGLNQFKFPGFNKRTGKPYSNPSIKPHQLSFLRRFKGNGYIFVLDSKETRFYAFTVRQMEEMIIDNPSIRSLIGQKQHEVDFMEFMNGVKELNIQPKNND